MSQHSERIRESDFEYYEHRYYKDLKNNYYKIKISNSTYRCPFCMDKQDYSLNELLKHASRFSRGSRSMSIKDIAKHSALQFYIEKYLDVNVRSEPVGKDQLFVWPWMGIVANIATEFKKWKFNSDWDGFINAMNFERSFEADHCGKKDYYGSRQRGDRRLYGWVARDDDYHLNGMVGDQLRKTGDLKTVSGKEAEDKRKTLKLVSGLTNTLKVKNQELEQACSKYDEINVSLNRVMDQKEEMIEFYNNEIKTMQQSERDHLEKILRIMRKPESVWKTQKKELEYFEKGLQKRQRQNDYERKKLYHKKKNNEMAIMEQKKADEKMMHLAEEQKKEKEKLHKKIHELQRKLDAKQALELEIEHLRGALQVMKHMGEDDEEKKKLDAVKMDLQDKEEELKDMEEFQQFLVVKERRTNDELQDARKELIAWLGKRPSRTRAFISVKRMGELDGKPFLEAAKIKFSKDEVDLKAVELCSQWEDYIRNPSWHPFKVLADKEGNTKEILDEEDEKLKSIKDELGDEVFGAVATALKELNEYNPSGRYPLPELWNFKEGRKASLKEGVSYIINQWKTSKRRRT
ncbi:Zinc finger-XS domain [Sesbania bispinosa]|nr:Zinc finger-XS domain [Sesbania bispinosa]